MRAPSYAHAEWRAWSKCCGAGCCVQGGAGACMSAQFQARGLGCVPGSWRRPRSSPQLTQHEAWVAFRLRGSALGRLLGRLSTRPGLRSGFVAAPSVVSSADSARGLGCVSASWRTCSAAVACGTYDRSVSPIGGTMGPLMRTLTRLVERGRGCPRSTHGAHAPFIGPRATIHARNSPTGTKPTPIPCQARPTRIGCTHADRLCVRG